MKEEQQKAEEEEDQPDEEDTEDDEDKGIEDELEQDQHIDPIDDISVQHSSLVRSEVVTEQINPAVEDVLMGPQPLHLPVFQEVEQLALLLVKLVGSESGTCL